MDDIHSQPERTYLPRWLAAPLREALEVDPVVVLSGPRQVGKSTLLANEEPFSSWRYVTMDDFDALDQARRDPSALWAGAVGVVLDEVQKAPGLLDAVKAAVDHDRSLRFALSGSANLLLMKHVSESLAGRATYFTLSPMTLGEANEAPSAEGRLSDLLDGVFPDPKTVPPVDPRPYMARGLMPRLLMATDRQSATWWEGYAATYLERDLRQLSQVDALPAFRRLMEVLALRQGGLLNKSEASRDASVTQPTGNRYVGLLEASGLVDLVPVYARNRTKRLVKSPKAYWFDPGLASYLCGHYSVASLEGSREAGGAFECLVHHHLSVLSRLLAPRARLHYWRTVTGQEVDFVVEHGRHLAAFEVKLSDRVTYDDARGLAAFMDDNAECRSGVLVYTGSMIRRLGERLVAIPWSTLAGVGPWR